MDSEEKKVACQQDLDELVSVYNWEDAFIKEVHSATKSHLCLQTGCTMAADAPFLLRVIVVFPEDKNVKCLELIFTNTTKISFCSDQELDPTAIFRRDWIDFRFLEDGGVIRCQTISYRILDECIAASEGNVFNAS